MSRTPMLIIAIVALLGACTEQPPADGNGEKPMTEHATPASNESKDSSGPDGLQVATFGTGCFWCSEAVMERLDGVVNAESGYMGGDVPSPTYKQVCTGDTGHAEVVHVTFDPKRISYEQLLQWFWKMHDPTTLNRQGADRGTQYRSVIFYHSDEQRKIAEASRDRAQADFRDPIVTEITAAGPFWKAEDYHQDYYRNNPRQGYCRAVIAPKLDKLGMDH